MYILKNPGGGEGPDPKELYSDHQTYYMAATRKVLWRPQNNYLAVAILLLWWPPDKSFGGRKINFIRVTYGLPYKNGIPDKNPTFLKFSKINNLPSTSRK